MLIDLIWSSAGFIFEGCRIYLLNHPFKNFLLFLSIQMICVCPFCVSLSKLFGCITCHHLLQLSHVFRALKTIIPREEEEKLNVWVAYFNLENEYGSPREVKLNNDVFWVAVLYLDILRHLIVYTTGCCEKGIPKSLAIL